MVSLVGAGGVLIASMLAMLSDVAWPDQSESPEQSLAQRFLTVRLAEVDPKLWVTPEATTR